MAGIKKKVDVLCQRSFNIGVTPFRGNCTGIILDADGIRTCLENKAIVKEVLKNGRRYPLDFTNYNKKNPMGFDVDNQLTENATSQAYSITTLKANSPSNIAANQPPVAMLMNKRATDTGALQAIGGRSQTKLSEEVKNIQATQQINAKLETTDYTKQVADPTPIQTTAPQIDINQLKPSSTTDGSATVEKSSNNQQKTNNQNQNNHYDKKKK